MRLATLLLLSVCVLQADLQAPVAGVIRDRRGYLRQMLGVPGAFVAGEALASGIISASFSGKLGLAKTEDELLVFDSLHVIEKHACPSGAAEFSFDEQGRPQSAYFASTSELWRWSNGRISVTVDRRERKIALRDEERMSGEWTVLHAADGDFAVRGEQSLQLPEVVEQ